MDKEILQTLQFIIDNMATKTDLQELRDELRVELRQEIAASETRTKVFIENNVSKKIESLFDGYKLTHEKQWEPKRRMDALEQKLEALQNQIA